MTVVTRRRSARPKDRSVGSQPVSRSRRARRSASGAVEPVVENRMRTALGVAGAGLRGSAPFVPEQDRRGSGPAGGQEPLLEPLGPAPASTGRAGGRAQAEPSIRSAPRGRGGGTGRRGRRRPAHQLAVHSRRHHLVEPVRRPPGRQLTKHLGDRVGFSTQPAVQLLQPQVDQPRGAGRRGSSPPGNEPSSSGRASPSRALGPAHRGSGPRRARLGPGWARSRPRPAISSTARRACSGAVHRPTRSGSSPPRARSRMMPSCRKFSPTNSSSPAQVILALGDQGRVRISRPSGCRTAPSPRTSPRSHRPSTPRPRALTNREAVLVKVRT